MENDTQNRLEEQVQEEELNPEALQTVVGGEGKGAAIAASSVAAGAVLGLITGVGLKASGKTNAQSAGVGTAVGSITMAGTALAGACIHQGLCRRP